MSRKEFIINMVAVILVATAIAGFVFWFAISNVGPGCPGDPEWLGPCSAVEGS